MTLKNAPSRLSSRLANTILVVVLAVTVLGLYLTSYGTGAWLLGRGTIALDHVESFDQTAFAPIVWYEGTELPGGSTINTFWSWMYWRGTGHPQNWQELSAFLAERKARSVLQ